MLKVAFLCRFKMDADSDIGFASTQSDEDESSTENEYYKKKTRKRLKKGRKDLLQARDQKQNIILKLRNREVSNEFIILLP